ncbi:hypothetical protein TNIN_356211 [Trichonephila inaurata madagascariensis]|uniref:Uncharacterized protein n=1 Tax=Trichonephila inaurata madagascariensis TaxID=2747483 RepID=A0A8X6IL42_9ARAC|nr:hypothetical protein TNIN_356211 [Trichonephila inaurata madagascariensis]
MKGRKSESNIDHRRSLRKRPQEEGTHELSTLLPDQRDEMADASKSRRHSSVATLPLRESSSNVNKTLNTSVKRHKESTPENEILYDKSAKQSLIEPVQSPVTTVVTNEEAMRESHGDALDIHGRTFKKNKPNRGTREFRKKRTDPKIRKEEGPLRIKPSSVIKKKIHVSKTGTGPFQPCIDYGPDTIDVLESVEIPERESKKDETSKNISNKLNRNAILSDSTKIKTNNTKSKELRGK